MRKHLAVILGAVASALTLAAFGAYVFAYSPRDDRARDVQPVRVWVEEVRSFIACGANDAGCVTLYDAALTPESAANPVHTQNSGDDGGYQSPAKPIEAAQVGLTTLPQGSVPADGGAGDAATQPATEVPPGDAGFSSRTSLTLQNLGTAPICCGFDPNVTCATGIQIDGSPDGVASGGSITLSVSQGAKVYCWSQSGQVAPGNVRWIQSR
jgi:hypothetical protein